VYLSPHRWLKLKWYSLHPWRFSRPDRIRCWVTWSDLIADPALNRKLDQVTSWGPFQSELCCDPVSSFIFSEHSPWKEINLCSCSRIKYLTVGKKLLYSVCNTKEDSYCWKYPNYGRPFLASLHAHFQAFLAIHCLAAVKVSRPLTLSVQVLKIILAL